MKTFRFLLLLTAILTHSLIFTQYSSAQVDCDQMVEDCKADNPYNIFFDGWSHLAYNLGCESAGSYCEAQVEENEQEDQIEP